MYKYLIRPFLFLFDPEKVHYFTFSVIRIVSKIPGVPFIFRLFYQVNDKRLERELFGLKFKNPVGLAAGFDKDARLYKELSNFGFGFIEIGTITPNAQLGNKKPRLFRLPEDRAIINRMGFNNGGAELAVERLKKNKNILIGGNIGKNKITEMEDAAADYVKCFDILFDYVDYFVINVSSPNTLNLRILQEREPLSQLVAAVTARNAQMAKPKPILLKIAPDLNDDDLLDIVEVVQESGLSGVIATNTSISREDLISKDSIEMGGMSGKPLKNRSTEVIRFLAEKSNHSFPIIGVGGIHSAADALEKIEAGATLVQLYTGFIYEGPSLVKSINKAILRKMK